MEELRKKMANNQPRQADELDSEERARGGAIPRTRNYSEEGRVQDPQVSSLRREDTEVTETNSQQMTSPGREVTEVPNSQKFTPRVETITPQNRGRVSEELKGLIVNPDGTMTATPQFSTWIRNPDIFS